MLVSLKILHTYEMYDHLVRYGWKKNVWNNTDRHFAVKCIKRLEIFLLILVKTSEQNCTLINNKLLLLYHQSNFQTNIYYFKVNKRNSRKRCEICSKLTIKTLEQGQWRHSDVFIVNFEYIFQPIFYCFFCWFWTSECLLGYFLISWNHGDILLKRTQKEPS